MDLVQQGQAADWLALLRCPACDSSLSFDAAQPHHGFSCATCKIRYPVAGGIPRFTGEGGGEAHTASFGYQWRRHSHTQLDSHSGHSLSKERFYRQTSWSQDDLRGKRVLEVGCGAGRFTSVVLEAAAEVWAIDHSLAVEACLGNHPTDSRLRVMQADLYHPPFSKASFDFIFCFGVLQHTPDPRGALLGLIPFLKPGTGRIAVDIYPATLTFLLHPKYLLRPLTRRMRPAVLHDLIKRLAPGLLAISDLCHRIPLVGKHMARCVPIANYRMVYPLNEEQLLQWAILDTFDWFSPRYDRPARMRTLRKWVTDAGLLEAEVLDMVVFVARGRRPALR